MESLLLSFGSVKLDWNHVILSFLLAFLCSSLVAAVYEKTYAGLSWSRGLLQTMILGSMTANLIMIAVGDNVARGIGIVGSLAIIRFRTNLRDPRDLVFLFSAMGIGGRRRRAELYHGHPRHRFLLSGGAGVALHAIRRAAFARRAGALSSAVGPSFTEQVTHIMTPFPPISRWSPCAPPRKGKLSITPTRSV
jgi:hypothetical protein